MKPVTMNVEIVVNNAEFGTGQVIVKDQQICVEIVDPLEVIRQ